MSRDRDCARRRLKTLAVSLAAVIVAFGVVSCDAGGTTSSGEAGVVLIVEQSVGQADVPPNCGSAAVSWHMQLSKATGSAGNRDPISWHSTLNGTASGSAGAGWYCNYTDSSHVNTTLVTGQWQISASASVPGWQAACTEPLGATVNSFKFTYELPNCQPG